MGDARVARAFIGGPNFIPDHMHHNGGAVIFDHAHEIQTTGIPDDGMVSIVSKGQIYMITEQAVTPADPVFVRFNAAGATGTTPAVGQVRKDADTAKADAVTSARFMGVAAAGALVLVDWNLP